MSESWYIRSGDQVQGPLSEKQLRSFLGNATTLVDVQVRQGTSPWVEALVAKSAFEKLLTNGWYIQQDLKQFGPFTLQRVLDLWESNQLRENAMVRHGSSNEWLPAQTLNNPRPVPNPLTKAETTRFKRSRGRREPVSKESQIYAGSSRMRKPSTRTQRSLVWDLSLTFVLGILALTAIASTVWLTYPDNRTLALLTTERWLSNFGSRPTTRNLITGPLPWSKFRPRGIRWIHWKTLMQMLYPARQSVRV